MPLTATFNHVTCCFQTSNRETRSLSWLTPTTPLASFHKVLTCRRLVTPNHLPTVTLLEQQRTKGVCTIYSNHINLLTFGAYSIECTLNFCVAYTIFPSNSTDIKKTTVPKHRQSSHIRSQQPGF